MAHTSRVIIVCAALIVATACNQQAPNKQANAPTGPAAAVATNHYSGEGVVKAIDPKTPAIEIDHKDIEGLMPAMQMEFPVTDPGLLNGIAVNDRIDFTIETAKGEMKVSAIKKKQ
ncbi:MAG TPA: copper-binding protein [Pyrinomonadaceae bacterium]|jgi:Cu/Ag efflux protein CusF|nr:copper-binding protein [Pyrinomonadaceae bacterium]